MISQGIGDDYHVSLDPAPAPTSLLASSIPGRLATDSCDKILPTAVTASYLQLLPWELDEYIGLGF